MSNKFKRVAESESIPENLQQAFFGADETEEDDQFRELRAGKQQRKRTMAHEENTGRVVGATKLPDRSWERKTVAEVYQDNKFSPDDDEMSNLNPYDVSGHGVRRASYDTDDGLSARNIHLMDEGDAWSLMTRESSIWDDDREAMVSRLDEAMEEHDARFGEGNLSSEQKTAELHNKNERRDLDELRGRKYSSSRANPLVRTFNEYESASAFGQVDYQKLKENEQRRHASIDEKREERLAIKESRKSRREQHQDWESDRLGRSAERYQDKEADWIDDAMNKFRN